jgi:hypothetical protein
LILPLMSDFTQIYDVPQTFIPQDMVLRSK